MTDHSLFLSQKRFGSLDGLRCLSIICVIWHHTAPSWTAPQLAHFGAQGVTLFFAISGFLITTLLLRERTRNGSIDLKAFYLRRSLRIFPLYYGVLLIYVVLVATVERHTSAGKEFFGNLPYFGTYTSNLFVPLQGRVIFYFAWSLATEEQFYLLWPSLLCATRTGWRAFILLGLICIFCIADEIFQTRRLSAVPIPILAGAMLAIGLHSQFGFAIFRSVLGFSGASVAMFVLIAVALFWIPVPAFLLHLLFVAFVGSCVIHENHSLSRILTLRPVVYVGSISYGMYMLHMLCKHFSMKLLHALGQPTNGLEIFALTLLIAVLVAGVSFRYYEEPFLKLKTAFER